MKAVIERTSRLLNFPLRPAPRGLLLAAALLLGATCFLPLWKVATFPPGVLKDGTSNYELLEPGAHVGTSDASNDVTGPRDVPADFVEFKWIPFALGILGLLFLRAAVLGTMGTLVDVFVVFAYFAAFSFWSFGSRFSQYGRSYPGPGAYAIVGIVLVLGGALFLAWRQGRSELASERGIIG
jgi:copper chaperone NosL